MPKSMMSSPRARAAFFNSPTILKTYGGRRLMRSNSASTTGYPRLMKALAAVPTATGKEQEGGHLTCASASRQSAVSRALAGIYRLFLPAAGGGDLPAWG